MPRKKRYGRGRSPHPGVVIKTRTHDSGQTTHRARWADPATGREVNRSLDALGLTNEAARRDWCIRKSREIKADAAAIAAGERPQERLTVAEAVAAYFEEHHALAERTRETYRASLDRFLSWTESQGLTHSDEITARHLAAYRTSLASTRKRQPAKGKRRGQRKTTGARLSARTVNRHLTTMKTVLGVWRRQRLVPLSRDDIEDALVLFKVDRVPPQPLTREERRELLRAALRHDAATYTETRAEHRGEAPVGTTPRHAPLAPFVLFMLLGGCRAKEGSRLEWSAVHLADGDEPASFTVEPHTSKTRKRRVVSLAESPCLARMFAAMRLRSSGDGSPFGFCDDDERNKARLKALRARLVKEYGAPDFTWQRLRQTTASILANAGGIFGTASAPIEAQRLGHAYAVAERDYVGLVSVPLDAKTIEAAMGVEDLAGDVVEACSQRASLRRSARLGA